MKKLKKFSNGLTLVYQYVPTVHSVATGIFVRAGSVNENSKNNGISHFLEHMSFKGTTKRTAFDIVAETDNIGAQINAYTSKWNTCYYTVSVDTDTEKCFDILSDIFFNSSFPPEEIEKEKGVVLEEISMTNDTPDDLCTELAAAAFYKGHPLSRQILGTRENVKAFTQEDLKSYVVERYTADNTVLSVVGNIKYDEVIELVNKYFNNNFGSIKSKNSKIKVANTNSVFVKKFKKIEQSHLTFVFPSMPYSSRLAPAVKVFNTAFGYGMSSRLFQHVREQLGLAYSVYSYTSFYAENGNCLVYLGTNVESVEKAALAVRTEIEKVKKDAISVEEFERGKAQIISSFVFGQESTSGMMNVYGKHALMTGKLFDFDEQLDDIKSVTLDDVKEVINTIFDFTKVTAAYVGPKCDVDLLKIMRG